MSEERSTGPAGGGDGSPRRRPRRRRSRRPRAPRPESTEKTSDAPAHRIVEDLGRLLKELMRERLGDRSTGRVDHLRIQLGLEPREEGQGDPEGRTAEGIVLPEPGEILAQLREIVEEAAASREVYREGHVFCFWCESAICSHSRPPGTRSVFTGYSPTGAPRWKELPALLLESGDDRVETLYRKPPHLVSVLTRGDRLKEEQLRVFGRSSRSYNVLAQVAAGFLPVRTPSLPEPDACAVTVQAVETRGSRGEVRLHLNIVGVRGDGQNLVEEVNESLDDRFLSVLVHARRRLADLEAALHRHRHERLRKVKRSTALRQEDIDRVAAIVLTVGRGFEQVSRQRVRRTKHAEDHVARGNRPTGKALEDASAAEAEKFLHDRRTGAIVVLGPRCRVHVFGTEGKHVTSLVLKGDQVERRLYTRRWEILDVVSRDRFLTRLRSRIDDEEARGA